MRKTAILWDGFTRINGFLEIGTTELTFHFVDFTNSSLTLKISFEEIDSIKQYYLYSQEIKGIKVMSKDGRRNIFILDEANKVQENLISKIG